MTTPRGVRFWRQQAARPSPRAVRARATAGRERTAGLARHGPAGARRRLRPDGLCAEPRAGRQAPRRQQRQGARASSARRSASPTGRARSRSSTSIAPSKPNAPINIFIHGGAWRANRAADYAFLAEPFVRAGAHYVILDFTNVDDAGGNLLPMVEQVRRAVGWVYKNAEELRRRSEPALSHLALLRLASRRLRGDARLAQGRPADRHPQGRGALQRHVRSQAGAAVEALEIRQLHRRDGGGAERAAASRPAQPAAHPGLRHLRDAGIPAPDPRLRARR